MISDGVFGDTEYFEDMVASVNDIPARGNDWFLLANDFASYMDAQVRISSVGNVFAQWSRQAFGQSALPSGLLPLSIKHGHNSRKVFVMPAAGGRICPRTGLSNAAAVLSCGDLKAWNQCRPVSARRLQCVAEGLVAVQT